MPLTVGTRLGPYEVLGVIGAGGMGEVYRARDTKLQRDVAIKVLPAAMADNPKRLLRFEREARALAALNHPNIASVYGIEEPPASGSEHGRALVMELVLGEDLSWILKRGKIPLADALPIARQVAEALAAAHDAGIVHRDLKPANIKVRDDGTVKVLDFGLAKGGLADADSTADSGSGSGSGSGSDAGSDAEGLSPTLTLDPGLTRDGAVLGTAAYMAPEQARGKPVDKRADIWAFGVVLFEMLTGRRPFPSGDLTEMLAHVLATDPDWSALPADTPPPVRRLLARCLTKDRKQRLHDIADARIEIDEAITPRLPGKWVGVAARPRTPWARRAVWAGTGLMAGLAMGVALWVRTAPPAQVTYAQIGVAPAGELDSGGVASVVLAAGGARTALAWSPDGRTLAFVGVKDGVRQIYLRDLSSEAARPLAGTEGAGALAFSPDGSEIAFGVDRTLRRVKIAGGPAVKICDTDNVNGISWGGTRIVFTDGAVSSVDLSAEGAKPQPLFVSAELVRGASPFLLPGNSAVLYTEHQKQWTSGDERVMALTLDPGAQPKVLLSQAADARYLSSGDLAFVRQGTLFVVPFDARTLELRGEPVAVLKDVAQAVVAWDSVDLTLAGQFAISPQGTLAYVSGATAALPDRDLIAVDRQGRVESIGAPPKAYRSHVELSPDGNRLGVSIQTPTDLQLFSYDLTRHSLSRLAEPLTGELILGAWSRDERLAIGVVAGGKITSTVVRPDAAAAPVLLAGSTGYWPSSWSPDGRLAGMMGGEIFVYSSPGDPRPVAFTNTPNEEVQPAFSPDGRWITYSSRATGRPEVYVRPYPGPGEAILLSVNGGSSPAWNPDGRELFYIEPGQPGDTHDRLMTVRFAGPGRAGEPEALFSFERNSAFLGTGVFTPYAVAPGGLRFYAVRQRSRPAAPVTQVNVVLNWAGALKK